MSPQTFYAGLFQWSSLECGSRRKEKGEECQTGGQMKTSSHKSEGGLNVSSSSAWFCFQNPSEALCLWEAVFKPFLADMKH